MDRFCTQRRAACLLTLIMFFAGNIASINAQNECNSLGAPLESGGSIEPGDVDQTNRLFRTATNTTTCQLMRTPTLTAGTFDAEMNTFTNNTGGPACVFVDLDANGCGVVTNQVSMAAYLGTYDPANILTNLIAEPGGSSGQNFATSMSFNVPAGATYIVVVHNVNAGTSCPNYTLRRYITNNCRKPGFDHNNDGSADLAIWRPSASNSLWRSYSLATRGGILTNLGSTGDNPVAADYDGDEITEPAVFRGSAGTWFTSTNPATNYGARSWGLPGDVPVQGDYDRDGMADLAVFRPSTSNWYVLRSGTSTYHQFAFGSTGDIAVVEDFDGDGRTDPAVFRPSTGFWDVLQSGGSYNSVYIHMQWGLSTDKPVPADYDGDGKADIAVYRPGDGKWYIWRSSVATGQAQIIHWGSADDNPQPADYDGDRKVDQAVFRSGTWWLNRSTAGQMAITFGQPGDVPSTRPFPVP
ncbi:MAG TPA: VCBS repeat-containing protein [Pyrinomonadaceae bacterium]|nr:VCBS repeat-containing protein [Pyrinomonadaceae bacterium]